METIQLRVTLMNACFTGQSPTSTTGAKKRAAPKRTKKDPDLDSDVSKKPNAPKTKTRRKRKASSSDDSDSNFEKLISKAVTSKVFILVSPFTVGFFFPLEKSYCKTRNQALRLIMWHIFKKINVNPLPFYSM